MMDRFEKECVENMAISFEKQLSFICPGGPGCFDIASTDGNEEGSAESNEAPFFHDYLQSTIDGLPYQSDFDELKTAFTIAVHRWKIKNIQNDDIGTSEDGDKTITHERPTSGYPENTKTSGKSFSLMDQLQGGFAMPISLEDIEGATSSQERLTVFQKIIYSEDLLMDWNKIYPLLMNDLSASFLVNPDLALKLVNLHRKWFSQGRCSNEYTPLLYGICENLLKTLAKTIHLKKSEAIQDAASETTQSSVVVALVQNWRDMWLDLMQRNQYSEDLAEEMEKLLFKLFLKPGSCKMSRIAQKVLALVDPSAAWFQSWTNHVMMNGRLLSLFRTSEGDTKILPECWTYIRSFPDTGDNDVDDIPFKLYSTAILSAVLCRTRVSQFPWDALTNANPTECLEVTKQSNEGINDFRTSIDEMLNLFLNVIAHILLKHTSDNDCSNDGLKITVLNGIEAILAGSHDFESEFNRRDRKVKSFFQTQNIFYDKDVDQYLE